MASFAPIRGTRTQIGTTPIVDGQFLVETNQGANNRIYLDTGTTRTIVGGGTGKLPHITIIAPTGTTQSQITVTNPDGSSTTPVTPVSGSTFECTVNNFGTYIIKIGAYSKALIVDDASEYTIERREIDGTIGYQWLINGGIDTWTDLVLQANDDTVTFTNLDPDLGYKISAFIPDNVNGDLSIPKYTNINKTVSSGTMTLVYTVSGGTAGSSWYALRILK